MIKDMKIASRTTFSRKFVILMRLFISIFNYVMYAEIFNFNCQNNMIKKLIKMNLSIWFLYLNSNLTTRGVK